MKHYKAMKSRTKEEQAKERDKRKEIASIEDSTSHQGRKKPKESRRGRTRKY